MAHTSPAAAPALAALAASMLAMSPAGAAPDTAPAAPPVEVPAASAEATADPAAAPAASDGEIIEVTDRAPVATGAIRMDAVEARRAPGAFGEPLRALALLPGVATSMGALGYPVIRGAMPGESRYSYDGIELPLLYHLLVGNQAMHPGFFGDLQLSAGGYGAEHGRLLGGLVEIGAPPEPEAPRTELRSTLVELGAMHARRLSKRTSLIAAVRAGTLSAAVKLVDARANLHYADQQLRLVHQLGGGDRLVLTSLGAIDYMYTPPEEAITLGFHRLDARWERKRPGLHLRAGLQTELDIAGIEEKPQDFDGDGVPETDYDGDGVDDTGFRGFRGAGVRPYAEGAIDLAPWLTLRGGADARYRRLRQSGQALFEDDRRYLASARTTDTAGAWLATDLRIGRVTVTPGVRADTYHAVLPAPRPDPRHTSIDARLAIAVQLAEGVRTELSGGTYTAPPQVTLAAAGIALGPLPSTDGVGASLGLSRATQAQAGVRVRRGDLDASAFIYGRQTRYALDFSMVAKDFGEAMRTPCEFEEVMSSYHDRDVDTRALGLELMVRRDLGRRLSGHVSYSLGKIDRRLPVGTFPHDFDQRHTLNAAAQYRAGKWLLGAGFHLHSGRPAIYPKVTVCEIDGYDFPITDVIEDPTALRRLPLTWRTDLRAERRFRFASWTGRLILEVQNASLQAEVLGYTLDYDGARVVPEKIRVPVPMIGFEADF